MSQRWDGPTFFDQLDELRRRKVSGHWRLRLSDRRLVLHLREGKLLRVEDALRSPTVQLAGLLASQGLVPESQLNGLLDEHPGQDLGQVLLTAKILDAAALGRLRALQMEQLLAPLGWEVPSAAELDEEATPQELPGQSPVPLADLAASLRRRVQRWPELAQRFGALAVRVQRSPQAKLPRKLGSDARRVHELLGEGGGSLGSLLQRSPLGDYPTLEALDELSRLGLVELPGGLNAREEVERAAQNEASKTLRRRLNAQHRASAVLLVLGFLLALGVLARWVESPLAPRRWEPATPRLLAALAEAKAIPLRGAAEACRLVDDELPPDAEALVLRGCVRGAELTLPFSDQVFEYRPAGEAGFQVLAPPP